MAPSCDRLAASEQRQQQSPPLAPEINQQCRRGADMEHHQKRQKLWRILVDVPAQHRRQDHGVAEAADREQLAHTLDDRKENGLQKGHVDRRSPCARALRFRQSAACAGTICLRAPRSSNRAEPGDVHGRSGLRPTARCSGLAMNSNPAWPPRRSGSMPHRRSRVRQLRQDVVLAVAPDRAVGAVEGDEDGKAGQRPRPRASGDTGWRRPPRGPPDCGGASTLRRTASGKSRFHHCGRSIARTTTPMRPPGARPGSSRQCAVGVAFLEHGHRKERVERGIGNGRLRHCPAEGDAPVIPSRGKGVGFPSRNGLTSCAVIGLAPPSRARQQAVERAGPAADIEDARPAAAPSIDQAMDHRGVTRPARGPPARQSRRDGVRQA